jgi:hypothetical protein
MTTMNNQGKIEVLQRRVDDLLALVIVLNGELERSAALHKGAVPAALVNVGGADLANLASMVEHGWTWRTKPLTRNI